MEVPPPAPCSLLVADRVSRRFGSLRALRDVSLTVRPGEVLGLIGPNGSGKTTLFECLAGLLPLSGGTVCLSGARKSALFYLPDGITPWPSQSASFMLHQFAQWNAREPFEVDAIVRALDIAALVGARMDTLSKGQHKRVLLAAALLTRQPLLMLDEPFDGLDLRQTRDVMRVLRSHASEGRTLFLSIHQLGDAARVCDRFVLLSEGRVVGEGTLPELRTSAALPDAPLDEVFLALT